VSKAESRKHLFFNLNYIAVCCFVILGINLYWGTLDSPFILDDLNNITENRNIRIESFDLSGLWNAGFNAPCKNRPVSNISFALNYLMGRYDVRGYHAVNILIHIINGILVYQFLLLIIGIGPHPPRLNTEKEKAGTVNTQTKELGRRTPMHLSWTALAAALLWFAHPVQTQSVTYIVQRMNSLATMFYLLSLVFYVHGRLCGTIAGRWSLFAAAFLSWVMAMGSKEIAVTLPVIIVLTESCFFQNFSFMWLKRYIHYGMLLLIMFGLMTVIYLGRTPIDSILSTFVGRDFTPAERVLTQFRVVMIYISLLFYPHPSRLNLDHHILISHTLFDPLETLFSLIGIAALLGLGIFLFRKKHLLSFFIFWFFIHLALESSFFSLELIFEHRLYLPSVGFFLIITWLVTRFFAASGRKIAIKKESRHAMIQLVIFIPVLLLLSMATWQRNLVWRDKVSLWSDCVEKSPNKYRPHSHLGHALLEKGLIDEALMQFKKALEISPDSAEAHMNLGLSLFKAGKTKDAAAEYRTAIRIDPTQASAHNNLGVLFFEQGLIDKAVAEYRKALKIDPRFAHAHHNLGKAFEVSGMTDRAIKEYLLAIQLDPYYAHAYYNLGYIYGNKGSIDKAIDLFQKAIEINPSWADARYNLGKAYYDKGMIDKAIEQLSIAVKIKPDFTEAFFYLRNAFLRKKQPGQK